MFFVLRSTHLIGDCERREVTLSYVMKYFFKKMKKELIEVRAWFVVHEDDENEERKITDED